MDKTTPRSAMTICRFHRTLRHVSPFSRLAPTFGSVSALLALSILFLGCGSGDQKPSSAEGGTANDRGEFGSWRERAFVGRNHF
jgi:hypothetical protein